MQITDIKQFFTKELVSLDNSNHNRPANNYDFLKALAIIFMIIDHIGSYFYQDIELFRQIGRFAFPIFLFLVGYSEKYNTRYNLLFYGLVISLSHNFLIKYQQLDILVSIFLSLIFMRIMSNKKTIRH